MPLARMKVSAPRLTFLSWAMACISVSAAIGSPGMSAMRVGRPTAARWAATRRVSSWRDQAAPGREGEGEHHADRHRLAVEQAVGIAGGGFQRVAEGVAEIEQGAGAALLALVGGDDCGLAAAGDGDRLVALRPAGDDGAPVLLQPGEECGVVDQAVFGHLGIAGAEDARAQRIEHARIGQHQARLVERADQVLAARRC